MKVAIIKRNLDRVGGLEKQALRIAKGFEMQNCTVELISDASNIKKSYDIVLGIDRDLNQTHHRAGNGVHAAYLKTRSRWTSFLPRQRRALSHEKAMLKSPRLRHIITNSNMVKNEFINFYNIPENKITAIHNGVEWNELKSAFENRKKSEVFEFLFVGNDFRRKGLKPLLEALSNLPTKDWKLTVIGKDRLLQNCKSYAELLGLSDQVTFLGQTNPLPYYQSAHTLVLPTAYDPFANVCLEALAMGVPVITTPTNGASEVIDASNGIVTTDLTPALENALTNPFDPEIVRASVKHLDFEEQLQRFTKVCLST